MTDVLAAIDSPAALRKLLPDSLPALCQALREDIIKTCGAVGGHLGASLGAVEITVALHRVFHTPTDALVFDVGHQAYAHKILTGRRDRMASLRQEGGIAPFLDSTESIHDAFPAGHACTAVSAALGLLEAKRQRRERGSAVAIVGDGALTGGLTFEGLNNAGAVKLPLVVVLNDNGMSISENVGAVPTLLAGPLGRGFFEGLGFTYVGPVDGHDVLTLIKTFEAARRSPGPIVVHARTQKGRGFPAAELDARTRGHAMGPYELRAGKLVRSRAGHRTYSEGFADALEAVMAKDGRVVAVSPAMLEGSALTGLKTRYPERVFDVGIAEQHAVTFSAGLAKGGLRPVCLIYSTFLQRALDQVVHDVCIPKLPVIFAVDRAGLVGADGATHQGVFDVAFLRPLPGMSVWAPVVGEDLADLLEAALTRDGPTAIRFPRGTLPATPASFPPVSRSRTGVKARWLHKVSRPDLVVISLGPLGLAALEAATAKESWGVLDALSVSPLDEEAMVEATQAGRLLTLEEATTHGGLGSAVLELLARRGLSARVRTLGFPDDFVRHGEARAQRSTLGLDAAHIAQAGAELLRS